MARTTDEIKNIMLAEKASQPALAGLDTDSSTSVWGLMMYVIATAMSSLEKLFDLFKQQVIDIINSLRPGTPRWYVYMVKKFQYGFDLVPEQDYYDNTGIPAADIAASKIIAYAAFVEEPFVRMKLAKLNGNDLTKLTDPERLAVTAYVKRYKYAGVDLKYETITSTDADELRLVMRIKYNPLVLNGTGARIDGTNPHPVKDAVKTYLQNLDFNGRFSIQKLVDQIQQVPGVDDLVMDSVQSKYGALPFTSFTMQVTPDSGYFIIQDANLLITYLPA